MKETSAAIGAGRSAQAARQPGWLVWIIPLASILIAFAALGIAIQRAAAIGVYSSLITHQTLTPLLTTGFALMGALVVSRHPRHPIGWIFTSLGLLFALSALSTAIIDYGYPNSPLIQLAVWLNNWVWIPAVVLPGTFLLLTFPDGHLPSPRWRWVAWSAAVGLAGIVFGIMLHPGPSEDWDMRPNPFGIPGAAPVLNLLLNIAVVPLGIGLAGSLAAVIVRFRRAAGIQKEQLKWLVYGVGVGFLLNILMTLPWLIWPDAPVSEELTIVGSNLSILGIAAAAAVAIVRYRLYDINLIINRTLVYATLTTGVVALYALVVGALGALFQSRSSPFLSLLATGLAAVLVQPMRDRLQRLVNRLMYGERDDPYAVLAGLSRRLEGSLTPEATLPAVVETVAQALKLPYVAIDLKQAGDSEIAASYGSPGDVFTALPLIYQGETLGHLRLTARAPNETFTPAEHRLLRDIARHIGVTAHTVLLTQDLRRLAEDVQRSREDLVKSREEERRRIRRDLHDGLGSQLATLKVNLDVARNLVSRDPRAAEDLLIDLRTQSQAAIGNIRRLVNALRPPALDELGLVGAIQDFIRQLDHQDNLRLQFDFPDPLPRLPAAVEVAAYHITLEALTNIVRHSQGKTGSVAITVSGETLHVEIRDDGQGFPTDARTGVGMNSMRERAAELGGTCQIETLPQRGTRVLAKLPLG